MNKRTEDKLKDISGMSKAVNDLLQQAWERGYKYSIAQGVECTPISKEVKVLIDGEQIFPKEAEIDNAPTVEPKLSDEQIEKITDLLETEWGYEGIREDVSRILRGGRE